MDEYSTFQVSRILEIDRTRLQEWINRGFFAPHRKAAGKGTKAVFTREDLYRLELFALLLPWMHRSRAKTISNINFDGVGPEKEQYKYCRLRVSARKGFVVGDTELLKEIPPGDMKKASLFVIIINLLAIKDDVDGRLEG